jgi:pimeloyl-ACP methyl ester carboxylesterase
VALLSGCASFHKGAMPGEPKDATFATIRGARVRYVDKGEGSPVVLVHGFASAIEAWSGVLPELAKSHRVIALDLKGFGWTDRPEGDYSPEEQARIVLDLMTQRGIDKAAVVAHSWGSSIALAAAMAQPARVTRLALYDAWVYEEQLPTFFHWSRADGLGETLFAGWYTERPDEKMAMAFYDKRYVTEALVDSVEDALDRPGTVAAALAAVRGQRYADVQDKYRTIKTPTLLLWGREDQVTPLRFGERLSRELPQSKLIVYPLCGHFPMIEALAASNADLSAFLAEDVAAAPVVVPQAKPAAASDGT